VLRPSGTLTGTSLERAGRRHPPRQPTGSAPSAQGLRQPQGGQGRLAVGRQGRGGGPAGPQRRRQDHLVLHDRRPGARDAGDIRIDGQRSATCRSTGARAWA
jgi:hypothetical protein